MRASWRVERFWHRYCVLVVRKSDKKALSLDVSDSGAVSTHQLPLVAEAEGADGSERGRAERRGPVQDALVAETGLSVPAVVPQQQHVGQV